MFPQYVERVLSGSRTCSAHISGNLIAIDPHGPAIRKVGPYLQAECEISLQGVSKDAQLLIEWLNRVVKQSLTNALMRSRRPCGARSWADIPGAPVFVLSLRELQLALQLQYAISGRNSSFTAERSQKRSESAGGEVVGIAPARD